MHAYIYMCVYIYNLLVSICKYVYVGIQDFKVVLSASGKQLSMKVSLLLSCFQQEFNLCKLYTTITYYKVQRGLWFENVLIIHNMVFFFPHKRSFKQLLPQYTFVLDLIFK